MAHIREKPSPMFMNSGRRLPPRMRLPSTLEDKKHTHKNVQTKSNLMQMFGNFAGFPVKK